MKKSIYILALTVLAAACSLEEDMNNIVYPDSYVADEPQARSVLNSCYSPLKNQYKQGYIQAMEGTTDLASSNSSSSKDARLDITPASCGTGESFWQYGYVGVKNCNYAIYAIGRSGIDQEAKDTLLAEAKIMRAYYYYSLTSFFGDVPFYREHVGTQEKLAEVARMPRMSAVETRKALVEELFECVPVLKQVKSSEIKMNYAGAAMGWMLAAKMSMWNKDWDTALKALSRLEAIYGEDLSVYPISDIPFCRKNTPESIFEIQHTYTDGGLIYTGAYATIAMPYKRVDGTDTYTSNKVPISYLGSQATTYRPMLPTSYFEKTVMPASSGDLRRNMTMRSEWEGNAFDKTYLGEKFWCPGMVATYDSNNYKVFRYADAVLMMAECHFELGDDARAVGYLNKVRLRAGLDEYVFSTRIKLREEIRRERARELFGEFQRRYDLVRWGIWYEQVMAYCTYDVVQQNIRRCHEYYPIPDSQVLASGGVLDNKAYAEYGL